MNPKFGQAQHLDTLSRLVIRAARDNKSTVQRDDRCELQRDLRYVAALSASQLENFLALADTHHVIVRALTMLRDVAAQEKQNRMVEWCGSSLAAGRARIERALATLQSVSDGLESRGCETVVIKSLDHWPDLGSDLDLYTTADGCRVAHVMREDFRATPVERSWGDVLANKWNYRVPGLPELVEIHVRYLGQTGEHTGIARRVIDRRVRKSVSGCDLYVPAAEERIVISALQRMYRHFYFRLCDMIDVASLLRTEMVDFGELQRVANGAGIWPGVATFLCLIQKYIESYGGVVSLPGEVVTSACFHKSGIRLQGGLLRVSKVTAAVLYGSQLLHAGLRGDGRALVRLPLLPPLAVSALVVHSLTGSDKGVW